MAIQLDALSLAARSSAQASTPAPASARGSAPVDSAAVAKEVAVQQVAKAAPPPTQDFEAVVEQLNRMMQRMNNSLQFEVDKSTGKTVVRVVDSTTNEILRQFPTEEVLAIARALESAKGALFNESA
jgi:flagellar protein FlaG